ncbi:MAG TPA: hypothetical protein EYP21_10145, partial [Syntrophaceae bacterium]|nr:hypothetical protein [Syntrophaceae bacterium]
VQLAPGANTTVPIMINNITDPNGVGSATIELYYNPSVVHVTNVANGDFDLVIQNINNTIGVTSIGASKFGAGLTGSANIANVTLQAVGIEGERSPLNISILLLKNATPQQGDIPANPVNGTFFIIDQTPPSVTNPIASPDVIANVPVAYGSNVTWLIVSVTDQSAIDSVKVNLSAINGPSDFALSLYTGNVYIGQTAAPGVSPGTYYLPVNATDIWGNSNTSVNISLTVVKPTIVAIGNVTARPGENKTIPIMIKDITDPDGVGTVTIQILYNNSVVHVTNVTNGDFDIVSPVIDNANGSTAISASKIGAGLTGSAKIADVTLQAVDSDGDNSTLFIVIWLLKDATPAQNVIPANSDHGLFEIVAAICGDVNDDDAVNFADVTYLANHVMGTPGYETINEWASDVNGDDTIDFADVTYISNSVMGIPGYELRC